MQLAFEFEGGAEDRPDEAKRARSPTRGRARPVVVQLSLLEYRTAADPARDLPAIPARAPAAPAPKPTPAAAQRVQDALRSALGKPVFVTLTTNHHTMISFKQVANGLAVRAHAMFGGAPDPVLQALARFVGGERLRKAEEKALDGWIEAHHGTLTEARVQAVRLQPVGEHHDLSAIYAELNAAHFTGKVDAKITWSLAGRQMRRTSIKMGSYVDELRLIRIHPALDQAFVPRFFVEFVVFHEMLHQIHGLGDDAEGRRTVHGPAFRADERRFPHYRAALRWERENLRKLLKY